MSFTLDGATVLVTGGAGLIGSHIVDQLIDRRPSEIRVLDNLVRGSRNHLAKAEVRRPIVFLEGDIRDREAVDRAVRGCDYIFHQAAIRITRCAEYPRECIEVLVGGTFNIFEAAVSAGIKKIVYASSASVYGAAETYPTDEFHHPYRNRSLYGAAKTLNEGLARSFHDMYGLPSVGLRYFNVYGPRMDVTGAYTEVFIRWLSCVAESRRPQIFGDGSTTMDFVYVEDVARANLLSMEADRVDDVYNIGSGTEVSLLELWSVIQKVTGASHLQPEFKPLRSANPVPRRLADTRRAREELEFVTETSLEEGLRKLAAWHSEEVSRRKEF